MFYLIFSRRKTSSRYSGTCSMLSPMAFASFSSVAFRSFFSPDSIWDKAACVMPIFSATSFCVRLRYSRQARTSVKPFLTTNPTTSWGIKSFPGIQGSPGKALMYSSYGMTTKAGCPLCVIIWISVGALISLLYLLYFNNFNRFNRVKENAVSADTKPVTIFMVCQWFDVGAIGPTCKRLGRIINRIAIVLITDFQKLLIRFWFPGNLKHDLFYKRLPCAGQQKLGGGDRGNGNN